MATYGVVDAVRMTNGVLTYYDANMQSIIDAELIFDRFFAERPVPSGLGSLIDLHIDSQVWTADYISKGAPFTSQMRKELITQIQIPDKIGSEALVHIEDMQDGRFDEVAIAAMGALKGIGMKANSIYKDALCLTSSGTPVDPTALSSPMVTPYWWNSNDNSQVPPQYGSVTFSGGHDHIETGAASAITLARIYAQKDLITEHGHKCDLSLLNTKQKYVILQLGSENMSSGTIPQTLYDKWNEVGEIAGIFAGVTFLENDYIDDGVELFLDSSIKHPAYRKAPVTSLEVKNEDRLMYGRKYYTRFGAAVTVKGAGAVAHTVG